MKIQKLIVGILILALAAACNPLKQLHSTQDSFEDAHEAGNHEEALSAFDELEDYHNNEGSEIETEYLKMAARSAVDAGLNNRAKELLQRWIDRTDEFEAIEMLGNLYRETNDTDKEYEHWDQYWDAIESEEKKKEIGLRLFTLDLKEDNAEKALERFDDMPPVSDPRIMFKRVEALEATGEKEEAREECDKLIEKNPDFEPALAWKATDIYQRAEELYKKEMEEYEKNEEYTAYVYLRRELKKISKMYRQSRDIFEKLHEADPDNEQYIKYLKNIYLRLEMQEEAAKMDMLLEEQR
ncbi:MAG: tetratricopeptide repeat protein [Bacteroidota bacterium]